LSQGEYDLLASSVGIWSTLQSFKLVMLQFSTDMPCPVTVIPAMDGMYNEITSLVKNRRYSPAIWAALSLSEKLLNKYYSLMDNSEVYWIAMGWFLYYNFIYCLLMMIHKFSIQNTNWSTSKSRVGIRNGSKQWERLWRKSFGRCIRTM
jgi:hypothetical protein